MNLPHTPPFFLHVRFVVFVQAAPVVFICFATIIFMIFERRSKRGDFLWLILTYTLLFFRL